MFKRPNPTSSDEPHTDYEEEAEIEVNVRAPSPAQPRPSVPPQLTDRQAAAVRGPLAGGVKAPAAGPSRGPSQPAASGRAGAEAAGRSPSNARDPRQSHSVVDEWLTMRGDLETEGNLHVKGRVFGNVRCVSVICEVGALIDGEIDAEDVTVRGETRGTIRAHTVRLESTALVASDIFHESFGCEQGARISGRLALLSDHTVAPEQVMATEQAVAKNAERHANADASDGATTHAAHGASPHGTLNGNQNGSAH